MLRVFCAMLIAMAGANVSAADNPIDRVEQVKNSLVQVKTVYTKVLRGRSSDPESGVTVAKQRVASFERKGAGIIIDPSGLIVTNTHTIINAPAIFVTLNDGTKLPAQAVFMAPGYDFSFLRIAAPFALTPIQWADSSKAELGQEILGFGSSDFNNQSILVGQIKSLVQGRSTGINELLEVNLNMYSGDSGGPILDRQGRLLGLVMAKQKSRERSTFAIASNKILEQYMNYKLKTP